MHVKEFRARLARKNQMGHYIEEFSGPFLMWGPHIRRPANAVGSNEFNGLDFNMECIWMG